MGFRVAPIFRSFSAVSALLIVGAGIAACGSDEKGSNNLGTGGSSGAAGSTGTGTCGNAVSVSNTDKGACSCVAPVNHEICPAAGPTPDCGKAATKQVEACGVLVSIAQQSSGGAVELTRTSTTKEYAGSGPPDLKCFDKATWPGDGGPSKTVKMVGYARNFANGCNSAGSKVEVYKVKRTGGADDGELGDLVGKAVTIEDTACTPDTCKEVLVATKCTEGNLRKWRKYTYEGVPTETELVVKTSSADGMNGFATLYDYNVYVPNAHVNADGTWDHDVRVVVQGDYTTIPTTAMGRQIDPGKGGIAGEIHDCGDVRLSGASVDINVARDYRGYFTDVEDSPLPDPQNTQFGTSSLGLYSTLNVAAGPARVSAVGVVGGKVVTLGYYDVRVFPDAITAVTLRGLRPFQAKAAASKLARRTDRHEGSGGRRAGGAGGAGVAGVADVTGSSLGTPPTRLLGGRLVLHQPPRGAGYRVNVDALLLAREAAHGRGGGDQGPDSRVVDLGAGVGAVGLALLALGAAERAVLVEREPVYATLARANGEAFPGRVEVVVADALEASVPEAPLVVANPPYTLASRGPAPPEQRRAAARSGELDPFVRAAARATLAGGRAVFVYPCSELPALLHAAADAGLWARAMRFVHASPDRPARIVLVTLTREDGDMVVREPWIERTRDGRGEPQLAAFLRGE